LIEILQSKNCLNKFQEMAEDMAVDMEDMAVDMEDMAVAFMDKN
jgi:hypothetical protein